MKSKFLMVAALVAACTASVPGGESLDLLSSARDWTPKSPFQQPAIECRTDLAPDGRTRLTVVSKPGPHAVGGWVRNLPLLHEGKRYRFEVIARTDGLAHPAQQLWGLVTRGNSEFQELEVIESIGNVQRLVLEFSPVKSVKDARLHLYVAEAGNGRVTWETATLQDVTATHKPRVARLAAISGKPSKPQTPKEAIDFYVAKLDQAKGLNLDLICLPENVNVDEVPGDRWDLIEPIPGPTTERLSAKARELHVYIAASIASREGDVRRNTAVLIDRAGKIVAKYHKAQLTLSERLLSGITPGTEVVVHAADFGRVGLMVCYDHHYPEIARLLAIKGAEIIAMPNAADGREGGVLWESAMRIRAVDNHVYIVSAVNFGRSLVMGPDGRTLAMNPKWQEAPGNLVHADCVLGDSVANHTGQPINKRYLQNRRPELYRALTESLGPVTSPIPGAH